MKDDKIEGDFFLCFLFVRIYKQLDTMVQNGILLTFTRLATICFCIVATPVPFFFPHPLDVCTYGCPFQKPPPNQSRTGEQLRLPPRHATGPDMGLLFMGLNTSSSVQYVHYTFKHPPFLLVYSLVGVSHPAVCLSVHLYLVMCTRKGFWNSLDKKELSKSLTFSQH